MGETGRAILCCLRRVFMVVRHEQRVSTDMVESERLLKTMRLSLLLGALLCWKV